MSEREWEWTRKTEITSKVYILNSFCCLCIFHIVILSQTEVAVWNRHRQPNNIGDGNEKLEKCLLPIARTVHIHISTEAFQSCYLSLSPLIFSVFCTILMTHTARNAILWSIWVFAVLCAVYMYIKTRTWCWLESELYARTLHVTSSFLSIVLAVNKNIWYMLCWNEQCTITVRI